MSCPFDIVRAGVSPEVYVRLALSIASFRDSVKIAESALQNAGVEFYPEHQAGKWNGEGLPPVGAAVEAKCTAKTKARDWFAAEVLYISPYTAVLKYCSTEELDGEFVAHPATLVFQPRRTPEQIAADEREKAVKEMLADANPVGHMPKYTFDLISCLYDAGYRKIT